MYILRDTFTCISEFGTYNKIMFSVELKTINNKEILLRVSTGTDSVPLMYS